MRGGSAGASDRREGSPFAGGTPLTLLRKDIVERLRRGVLPRPRNFNGISQPARTEARVDVASRHVYLTARSSDDASVAVRRGPGRKGAGGGSQCLERSPRERGGEA